jgi:hypothetical protein
MKSSGFFDCVADDELYVLNDVFASSCVELGLDIRLVQVFERRGEEWHLSGFFDFMFAGYLAAKNNVEESVVYVTFCLDKGLEFKNIKMWRKTEAEPRGKRSLEFEFFHRGWGAFKDGQRKKDAISKGK